ncbi:MAG: hypothetical protein WB783_07705, partial [Arenicellales bacterium]
MSQRFPAADTPGDGLEEKPGSSPCPNAPVQTHLQLLHILHQDGYGQQELAYLNRSYWLAAEMFGAKLRGTGKPFLCHLVGTASAAALEKPPAEVLAAALCHGIYTNGDFGYLRDPQARTSRVRAVLGGAADEQLRHYDDFQRHRAQRIPELLSSDGPVTDSARYSALIWVANEVDDETDAGARFRRQRPDRERRRDFAACLCAFFGWTTLASAVSTAYAGYDA